MEKHFVEKYSGEYYFSSQDKDTIQGVGEEIGNGDTILFTYDEGNLEEPLMSMGKYLTRNYIFNREKLIEKLILYHAEQVGVYAAMMEITCDVIMETDTNKDMIRALFREKQIDKEIGDKLIEYLDEKLSMQLDFFKNMDKVSLVMYIEKRKERKKEK